MRIKRHGKFGIIKMPIKNFWENKRILITGFNGFKGSWISLLLFQYKAKLFGYSLKNKINTKNEKIFKLKSFYKKVCYGDIRDKKRLSYFINLTKPQIILHLAAQSLVIESYKKPQENFETNINGLLNLLELSKSKKITHLIVTSDKCYLNNNKQKPFKEDDALGGDDPYSASKAMAEILSNSYKKSYGMSIVTARGGNVIGGGDWNKYRIVTDVVNSIFKNKTFEFRNPNQVRPWQHVVDVAWNYLKVTELTFKNIIKPESWNIAPQKSYSNNFLIKEFKKYKKFKIKLKKINFVEKKYLNLSTTKSKKIGLTNFWNIKRSIKETYEWFKCYYNSRSDIFEFSIKQINNYLDERKKRNH